MEGAQSPACERASCLEFCSVHVPFFFRCAVGVSCCVVRHSGPFASQDSLFPKRKIHRRRTSVHSIVHALYTFMSNYSLTCTPGLPAHPLLPPFAPATRSCPVARRRRVCKQLVYCVQSREDCTRNSHLARRNRRRDRWRGPACELLSSPAVPRRAPPKMRPTVKRNPSFLQDPSWLGGARLSRHTMPWPSGLVNSLAAITRKASGASTAPISGPAR